jgi:hypothetical protein
MAGRGHPDRHHPLQAGRAEVEVSAFAQDPNVGTLLTVDRTRVVRRRRG